MVTARIMKRMTEGTAVQIISRGVFPAVCRGSGLPARARKRITEYRSTDVTATKLNAATMRMNQKRFDSALLALLCGMRKLAPLSLQALRTADAISASTAPPTSRLMFAGNRMFSILDLYSTAQARGGACAHYVNDERAYERLTGEQRPQIGAQDGWIERVTEIHALAPLSVEDEDAKHMVDLCAIARGE